MYTWKIDPVHSEIKFKVKHMLVSTVTGGFNKFDAEINAENENDFSGASVKFEADAASIDTKNAQRDAHLRSADFFDAENHPKLSFNSKSFTKTSDMTYKLTGDMTMRGITKEVELDVIYNGNVIGLDGSNVSGFEITGTLNRFDFGLQWNALTEAGGVAVGKDVKLEIFAEMKEAPAINQAA
jgi:polyisoprenoid-binding protein YceI